MDPNDQYKFILDPKYCFVPTCKNNSRNKEKRFFAVPRGNKQEWCRVVGYACPKRTIFICEDLLNLTEYMENYRYWITMKGRSRLKTRIPEGLLRTISSSSDLETDTELTPRSGPQKVLKAVQKSKEEQNTDCMTPIEPELNLEVHEEDDTSENNSNVDSTDTSDSEPDYLSEIPEGRVLVVRVYRYLRQELQQLKAAWGERELGALADLRRRTAAATGISEYTLQRILDEEHETDEHQVVTARNEAKVPKEKSTVRRNIQSDKSGHDNARPAKRRKGAEKSTNTDRTCQQQEKLRRCDDGKNQEDFVAKSPEIKVEEETEVHSTTEYGHPVSLAEPGPQDSTTSPDQYGADVIDELLKTEPDDVECQQTPESDPLDIPVSNIPPTQTSSLRSHRHTTKRKQTSNSCQNFQVYCRRPKSKE